MQRFTLVLATTAVLLLNKPALPQEALPAPLPARSVTLPLGPKPLGAARGDASVQTPYSPSIPLWNGSVSGFSYSMVGQNPQIPLTAQTTFVVTPVIPIVLTFADGSTFDPTAPDTCLGGNTAAGLTVASPLFANYNFAAGLTYVGAPTQYLDYYQRINFWQYTNPAGLNPNYHVLLSPSQLAAVRISVPAASGRIVSGGYCGGRFGEIDINWFDTYLNNTVFVQLASLGVLPSNFPVFLLSNVVQYNDTPSNCCIIGYHSAFYNSRFGNAIQTYAVASFDSSGALGTNLRDVAALSHEIGEWMDDPLANNPTPPWGNIGQVSGCQTDLENGDPLTGTAMTATMVNGFTYHVQELAFFSWFYNQTPSIGVNGWYSSNGSFRSPAVPCGSPATPTASLNVSSLNFSSRGIGVSGSPLFITLTNTGTTPLSGINVTLTGTNAGDFAIANDCPASLAANTSCTVPVTFLPTAAGTRSATVSFADSATGSPQTVALTGTATGTSTASLSASSLIFATQNTGTVSTAQGITLTNSGTAPLSLSGIALAGTNPGDFAQTNTCPATLAASSSCAVLVTFQPTTVGSRSATLNFADSSIGSPQTVTLTGTGAGTPTASLNVSSLSFSSRGVGVSGSPLFITLTNSGTSTLSGIGVSLGGSNAADFALTNNCPAALAANTSCTVPVTFQPTAAGARSAMVSFAESVVGSPQTVTLTGAGTGTPQASLNSSGILFTSQNVGTVSSQQGMTLTNIGSAPLTISGITLAGANPGDFAQTNTCPASLAVTSSCVVLVAFAPTTAGTRSAMVNFASNSAGSPQTVPLTGTGAGTPTASLNVSSLNFSSRGVGASGSPLFITLTNAGTSTLSGIGVSLTGSNAADFALTNNCPPALTANSSCTVPVTFQPTAAGLRSAMISFAESVVGSPQTVTLTGTGTGAPQVALSASGLTFISQTMGTTSAAQGVTLTNVGTAPLSIAGITLAGTNTADFAQTNTCPASLAANSSCAVLVSFQPTAAGLRSAMISFADNAAGSAQTVALTGTGASGGGGTPQVALNPGALTFASQSVGTGASQSITLSNVGTGPLTGIGISIAGANAGDFGQSNNCPTTLASNTSCIITITFTPNAAGTRSASVAISDNATGSPQIAGVTGTGLAAPALQPWINTISPLVLHANQTATLVIGGFNFQNGFTASMTNGAGAIQIPNSAVTFVSSNQIQITITPAAEGFYYISTLTITNPGGLKGTSQFIVFSY